MITSPLGIYTNFADVWRDWRTHFTLPLTGRVASCRRHASGMGAGWGDQREHTLLTTLTPDPVPARGRGGQNGKTVTDGRYAAVALCDAAPASGGARRAGRGGAELPAAAARARRCGNGARRRSRRRAGRIRPAAAPEVRPGQAGARPARALRQEHPGAGSRLLVPQPEPGAAADPGPAVANLAADGHHAHSFCRLAACCSGCWPPCGCAPGRTT